MLPVVIVHRNQPARLVETIAAFRAQDVAVSIAVVDNGSDEVPNVEGDDVVVIDAGRNLGFGPGANAGFRHFLSGERDVGLDRARAPRRAAAARMPPPPARRGGGATPRRAGVRGRG